jgi:hypothetical protein
VNRVPDALVTIAAVIDAVGLRETFDVDHGGGHAQAIF